ncbi:MAG TPA: adenine deaminase [Bacillota bacterium]|nr:adenine deaminase [Bacillota bacterium]
MEIDVMRSRLAMARGRVKADLVLKNGRVVNVFSGEVLEADVALSGDQIVGVGHYHGHNEIDLQGRYVSPGFIDAHVHLESTMLSPAHVVMSALARGTTTFIADPHEAANVAGLAGIKYILDQTESVPANVFVMMPSCVPATAEEDNGYHLSVKEMKSMLGQPRLLGLGEVMDFVSIIEGDIDMFAKLDLFAGHPIDGHAPGLSATDLSAYAYSGISSDHEVDSFADALRKRREGFQVLIRQGTAAHNLPGIIAGIIEHGVDTAGFSFCTDDKDISDIEREGHIDHNIRLAVSLGLDPVKAIQMASINTARHYGLRRLGGIAPGYQADLVILNDLSQISVHAVYHKGQAVTSRPAQITTVTPEELKQTVNVAAGYESRLSPQSSGGNVRVIKLIEGQIVTGSELVPLERRGGVIMASKDYNKVAVIERHKASGRVGIGFVAGLGLKNAALASSVGHDSHNIIVAGDNDLDMTCAVEAIIAMQGGLAVSSGGRIQMTLPLPVMGLISEDEPATVQTRLQEMKRLARSLGVGQNIDPFVTLSFIALPVIPELRITTRGLFDVVKGVYHL